MLIDLFGLQATRSNTEYESSVQKQEETNFKQIGVYFTQFCEFLTKKATFSEMLSYILIC